eukprot:CAMPEP_0182442954 /NCGR_PEP_ID=MMETSP1172-20130603/1805_1 /TAXON_ID=708627 /ORGANISM="Timspurckia oligopyrenoides, Strain CCMP3278" /LENGTH=354 /DNA_ID=CAMNT_0024638065 /DNA_START=70 /DNA_END=1131 /DNA_ORIENTATION=+
MITENLSVRVDPQGCWKATDTRKKVARSVAQFTSTKLFFEDAALERRKLSEHLLEGLSQPRNQKSLSSLYIYDDIGSELYKQITELEDYYPARCENEIIQNHRKQIVAYFRSSEVVDADRNKEIYSEPKVGPANTSQKNESKEEQAFVATDEAASHCGKKEGCKLDDIVRGEEHNEIALVELGAGDGTKTSSLIRELIDAGVEVEYIPIDISKYAIQSLLIAIQLEFRDSPKLHCHGLIAEYSVGLEWIRQHRPGRRSVVLFLGNSIGNFSAESSVEFLESLRSHLQPADIMMIGFDLKKDPEILRKAYSDCITSKFNLNLLARMNRDLGANFDLDQFYHVANYNPVRGCMDSW